MPEVRKVPYYQMESSAFGGKKWKGYSGSQGCVPIDTQKAVSMDRLAPGEPAPPPKPKPPEPTPAQREAQKAEEARQKLLAQQTKTQPQTKDKPQEKPPIPDAEECENPPVFDMLDIPDAMEKMKWPVSAKIARKWFSSPKNIYDDNPLSVQPIDDTIVTLDWALKFGSVKDKFNELLAENIYSEKAVFKAKEKISKKTKEIFITQNSVNLSFGTTNFLGDLRQFHIDWQFQRVDISNINTLDGTTMTDLTGALANFAIYVGIGNAVVTGDRYYKYDKEHSTKSYCTDPKVQITHVYVYIKDNYSFNDDKDSAKSQYLGHWNKNGLIVTSGGLISEFLDGKRIHTDLGNNPNVEYKTNWDYLAMDAFNKPVDTRKGMIKKFREQDVYFPIYNRTYNEWRAKHNRGGDFMIYSKPQYMKLKKPIEFSLETLCRQPEKM
jgi:hypothetical protein